MSVGSVGASAEMILHGGAQTRQSRRRHKRAEKDQGPFAIIRFYVSGTKVIHLIPHEAIKLFPGRDGFYLELVR